MTLDTQESLLKEIYDILTLDTDLQEIMGEVRLYPVWAESNASFPYLVHRIDMRAGVLFPERVGTYLLDIWSNSPNVSEILSSRKRLIEILDEYRFNTTEVKNVRIELETDGFIGEMEPEIWHYALQFSLRLWRQSELISILNR